MARARAVEHRCARQVVPLQWAAKRKTGPGVRGLTPGLAQAENRWRHTRGNPGYGGGALLQAVVGVDQHLQGTTAAANKLQRMGFDQRRCNRHANRQHEAQQPQRMSCLAWRRACMGLLSQSPYLSHEPTTTSSYTSTPIGTFSVRWFQSAPRRRRCQAFQAARRRPGRTRTGPAPGVFKLRPESRLWPELQAWYGTNFQPILAQSLGSLPRKVSPSQALRRDPPRSCGAGRNCAGFAGRVFGLGGLGQVFLKLRIGPNFHVL